MAFYTGQTFREILDRMMKRAPADVDRRENSSVLYNALAPAAEEIAAEYTALESIRNDMSIFTASDDAVVQKCADRLIDRIPAKAATVLGKFNLGTLPQGLRFSHDAYNYAIDDIDTDETAERNDGFFYYKLVCETAGEAPSYVTGALIPIRTTVRDLETAEIVGCISAGENEQSIESLRQAYINSFSVTAFGGNVASYRTHMADRSDVGSCLVYSSKEIYSNFGLDAEISFLGGVRIVYTGSNHENPSPDLTKVIQNEIDPVTLTEGSVSSDATGKGLGIAPVGATVIVIGATPAKIDISARFVLAGGRQFDTVRSAVEKTIKAYLADLNKTFGSEERQRTLSITNTITGLVVSRAQIMAAVISDVPEVDDITSLQISVNDIPCTTQVNGVATDTNAVLDKDSIAVFGSVTGV